MLPKLRAITLKSGHVIEIASGVTAIVGPNNAGKSLILRELVEEISRGNGHRSPWWKAVSETTLEWDESKDILEWMKSRYNAREAGQYNEGVFTERHYRSPSGATFAEAAIQQLASVRPIASELVGFYIKYLDAAGRLGIGTNANVYDRLRELPSQPAHFLYESKELEAEISEISEKAFGVPLTVNRHGGSQITLHMGRMATPEPLLPAPLEYLKEMQSLPQLQEQGDGMKAFLGIILTVFTGKYPLVIIDEPEAFLHPPQAYLLGKILAEQHSRETQVVLATHSEDMLRGIVAVKAETDAGRVSVVRLTRQEGAGNNVAQVPASAIKELYEDPLIKYYRMLEGLFFQGVVLCEADSDCTYYQAVLDAVPILEDGTPTPSVSLYFSHCGGKARLPKAVRALVAAQVPTACVVDIDFLREDRDFHDLVSAYRGDLEKLAPLRNVILDAINSKAKKVDRTVAQVKINEIFDARKGAKITDLSSGELARIKKILSVDTGWKSFQQTGKTMLRGEQVGAFEKLNAELRALGIFIVEVGELESFHPDVPADNKAAWLRDVLESGKQLDSAVARKFVGDIAMYVRSRQ